MTKFDFEAVLSDFKGKPLKLATRAAQYPGDDVPMEDATLGNVCIESVMRPQKGDAEKNSGKHKVYLENIAGKIFRGEELSTKELATVVERVGTSEFPAYVAAPALRLLDPVAFGADNLKGE